MRSVVLLVCALMGVVAPAAAQEAKVRVQADTATLTVGDRLNYRVTVEHPSGSRVVWPDSVDVAPFEVISARVLPTQQGEPGSTTVMELVLTVFELGEQEIPSISVTVEASDGSVTELESDTWVVEVVSVGLDEGEELREIKGPMSIALGFVSLLPWIGLALLLIGGVLWWWRSSRPGETRELGPVILPRPPHEVAHEALDELARSKLLERGEIKEFHVRLSEILRSYVEGRYEVRALEMTSGEVVDGLWRVGIEGAVLDRFRRFLERADLVKFAKYEPTRDDSLALLAEARELVDETRSRVTDLTPDEADDDPGIVSGEGEAVAVVEPVGAETDGADVDVGSVGEEE